MEILIAAVAAVVAAVAAGKALEQQKKAQEESRAKIPVRSEEPRLERRKRR